MYSPRTTAPLCYSLVILGAIIALAAALFMQHGKGLQPCTLCIIQRYAFIWVGLWALIALLLPYRAGRLVAALVGGLGALGGMVVAGRNLWVMAHPDILCGRDPVEIFLNQLPTAQWWPKVFMALGLCSDPIPPLFGLALPAWSLLGLFILGGLLVLPVRQR
ncbi:MAG: disulfide bond formation protein B [Fluviibacter sp.]|jgi:disulfide bond formation protein DsbB